MDIGQAQAKSLEATTRLIVSAQEMTAKLSLDRKQKLSQELSELINIIDKPDEVKKSILERASAQSTRDPLTTGIYKDMRRAITHGANTIEILCIMKGCLSN